MFIHEAVAIARDLIAIPSVNPMGKNVSGEIYSEKNIAAYISNFLRSIGVDFQIDDTIPGHPNVIGKIDLGASETLMLEAHMDTVSHENMSIDPFDPKISDGHLFGRGACDTKASIAAYLYAVAESLKRGRKFKRNIVLLFVYDEEYAFSGAQKFASKRPTATFAITGEPTSLDIIHAHKGICRFKITAKGKSSHAALPWLGDNAIYKMASVIKELESYAAELGKIAHPELGSPTMNIGTIDGGETVNTVPSLCTIDIDYRLLPGDNYQSIRSVLDQRLSRFKDLEFSPPYLEASAVSNDVNGIACTELLSACKVNGWNPKFKTAHYGTDASVYAKIGIPTIVFGPGDISLAHTAAEFVPVEEIEKASEIIITVLER